MIAIYDKTGKIVRVEGKIDDSYEYLPPDFASIPKSTAHATGPLRQGSPPISRRERKVIKRMTVECPECDADVSVPGDSDISDILSCEECGADLEIIGIDPLEVEVVEDSGEVEDDDW